MSFTMDSAQIGRSYVKSALAFASSSRIDVAHYENARSFLQSDNAQPSCYGSYFGADMVLQRPSDQIFHCIAISGSSDTRMLLCYIEYFSAVRAIVCLSENYTGPDIDKSYSIDPISGKELNLQFNIRLAAEDLPRLYCGEMMDSAIMTEALSATLKLARQMDFERAKDRAISLAVENAWAAVKAPDGYLTEQDMLVFSQIAAEQMMPFFRAHMKFERPENPFLPDSAISPVNSN
jgi:hypothetical protein